MPHQINLIGFGFAKRYVVHLLYGYRSTESRHTYDIKFCAIEKIMKAILVATAIVLAQVNKYN